MKVLFLILLLFATSTLEQDVTLSHLQTVDTCSSLEGGKNLINCDKINAKTPQTYALPIEHLEEALYRPIVPPDSPLIPEWYNATLYKVGQDFCKKHLHSVMMTPIGTQSLFTASPLTGPILLKTRKSSNPSGANRRFIATILHLKLWYEQPLTLTEEDELEDNYNPHVLQSLYNVQGIHFMLVKNYSWADVHNDDLKYESDTELWDAALKDLEGSDILPEYRKWPLYVRNIDWVLAPPPLLNQLTLMQVQYMGAGLAVLFPERAGIYDATEQELMGFLHMWAVLGHGLGIEDRFNAALHPNLKVAKEHFHKIFNHFLLPSLFHMASDPGSRMLCQNIFIGTSQSMYGEDAQSKFPMEQQLLQVFEDFLGIPCPHLRSRLSFSQSLLRNLVLKHINTLYGYSSWFKKYLNEFFTKTVIGDGAGSVFGIDVNDPQLVSEKCYA